MANYSIVINSRFKPFSYAEMLAPVQQSTEAHQQVEDAYANLATQAELVAGKANEQTDPVAYARYKSYADDLMAQADRLARYGLTPEDRRSMLGLRARYAKDIIPIQEAIETRKKQAEMQQQAYLQNPTLLLSRRASTTSLDDYLKNPNLEYDSYSGAMLTQQVSQQAQALAKELTEYGLGKPIDSYTNTFLKKHGFTSAQVLEAITNPNDPKSSPVLKAIVDQTLASSGVTSWGDEATVARARAYANQGLFSAVGTSDVAPMENFEARENLKFGHQVALENLQHRHAMARQRQAQAAQQAANRAERMKMYDINPTSLYSSNEIAAKNKKTAAELDKWRKAGYFTYDGKLTNRGWAALQYKQGRKLPSMYDSHGREIERYDKGRGNFEFYQWAKQHGVTDPSNKYSVNILNNYYQGTRAAIKENRLPTGTANFDVYRQFISGSTRKSVADKISAAIGNSGKIYKAGQLSNGSISSAGGISNKEFEKLVKANPIVYVINSPSTGNRYVGGNKVVGQQLIELKNGDKYILPDGILGNDTFRNLSNANLRIRQAGSRAEKATELNRANSYLGSIYTTNTGTNIKVNDGTSIFDISEDEFYDIMGENKEE